MPILSYRSEMAHLAKDGRGGFILFGGDIEVTPRYLAVSRFGNLTFSIVFAFWPEHNRRSLPGATP